MVALGGPTLVFVNGTFAPKLSSGAACDELEVVSLAEVFKRDASGARALFSTAERTFAKPFWSLNSAFFGDGALVRVRDGAAIDEPIHLVFVSVPGTSASMSVPRTLIELGAKSRARVVESYLGGGERTFTDAASEVRLAEGASLDHYRLQREAARAFHIGVTTVLQAAGSRFHSFNLADGGAIARHDLDVTLAGELASCALDGLYLVSSGQLIDQHTFIDHQRPRCTSEELYKGILDGTARGVFHGRILVREDAQKPDARQSNRSLLLTPEAQVNSKPQLEIHADDVKCTHGSAVGQLDREALFFMRSRGIGEAEAKTMLTEAFAREVTQRMPLAPVREAVETGLRERLLTPREASPS